MIKITVELISAKTGKTNKLGEMHIYNDGTGTNEKGNYAGRVLRKPKFETITKMGYVVKHDRINKTIWHLIAKMLNNMGYML